MLKPNLFRTHTCGELREKNAGQQVRLAGFVHARRDHGGIIFIDLRDRYGLMQLRFDPDTALAAFKTADKLRSEFVISVTGEVKARPTGMRNKKMDTGGVELDVKQIKVLSRAKTPPFEIDHESANLDEDVRLKYRYLDLRHKRMRGNISYRSALMQTIRAFFIKENFLEIETPVMGRETPEGARDYLVPSRVYPGEAYALAQAPQQYKQLLMVGGLDRYFQLNKTFRDEDPRADRFPEFTQVDMEMSFATQEDVMQLLESLALLLSREHSAGQLMARPIPRITFEESMSRFGTDKPDLRFGLELKDVSAWAHTTKFAVFAKAKSVQAITAPLKDFSRKDFDQLIDLAKQAGGKGLAWITYQGPKKYVSPIAKFFSAKELKDLVRITSAKKGESILFIADDRERALNVMGRLRNHLGDLLELKDPAKLAFSWIYDFPMFEYNKEEQRLEPMHHMFTQPYQQDLPLLDKEPLKVRAQLYDLVLNGYEIGSGSVRIWQAELQRKVMGLIGLSKADQEEKFGHMLRAFEYGAPPHAGMAWGLDRLAALLRGEQNIRDLIAFPMNSQMRDVMTGAPSPLTESQLKELGLRLRAPRK